MLVLSVVTYAWRIFVPHGAKEVVLGLPTPDFMPQYVLLFAVGIAAYRHRWLVTLPRRSGWFGVLLVVASLVPLALGGYRAYGVPGALTTYDPAHLALALSEALLQLDAAPVPKFLLTPVLAAADSWAISGALRRVPAVRAVV